MIIGMDFGTTNSGMAVYDGRSVNVLSLDPSNANPGVARTALYITNDQSVSIGRGAVDRYFGQNVGRPAKMQKVWVGEIEVIADRVYYVTDVYVWVDALSPGRLFLSIKTGLRDENYTGTVVGRLFYSLETLIALYMSVTKARAEQLLGREIKQVVLGRPVHFAADDTHDKIAEARLLRSAFMAGYEKVYLQYEPIAAAYSYELTLERPQNVLVFDFGGGTLDITVVRLGEKRPRVLSTGGIPVAGDVFDRKLVRAKLPRHFGEGSFYGQRQKALTVPTWIYDSFSDWQSILELQSAENRQVLREIAQTAQRRYQIEALLSLVSNNYGLTMYDVVERAKRTLSEKRGAEIRLQGPDFDVREFVTRSEFETIIRPEIRAIDQHLQETVHASGLRPEQIDAVIRTGGSAQIPAFYELLGRHFGVEKVRMIDPFSSVTAGLGVLGYRLERGEVELAAHTADQLTLPEANGKQPNVSPVNLEMLQRRIVLDEKKVHGLDDKVQKALLLISDGIAVDVQPLLSDRLSEEERAVSRPVIQALVAGMEDQILLVTTDYRFLLVTPRQLGDLQALDLTLGDLFRLKPREMVCAAGRWEAIRNEERLLLVTSTGFVRAYPLEVLRENIEGPVPLMFDTPPAGVPVAICGVRRDEEVALLTEGGRGLRLPLQRLPLIGLQAINLGREDRLNHALVGEAGTEAVLLTADGYGRRMRLGDWEIAPKANAPGKALVARRSPAVALAAVPKSEQLWVVTSQRITVAGVRSLPISKSTSTDRLLRLAKDEMVQTVVAGVGY
jgi:hypothetical chaperone protein